MVSYFHRRCGFILSTNKKGYIITVGENKCERKTKYDGIAGSDAK